MLPRSAVDGISSKFFGILRLIDRKLIPIACILHIIHLILFLLYMKGLKNRKGLLKGRCARCQYLDLCNGNLRVRAEAVFGDVWAEDPACYLTDEEIGLSS